jgi:hypothetical protein
MANLLTKGYERVAEFRAQAKEDRESVHDEQDTGGRTRGQGRGRGRSRERER